MYSISKEFYEIQLKFEESSIKSYKRRITWQYILLSLHSILTLIYGIQIITKGTNISIICTILWGFCVFIDILPIRKLKKSISECETTKLNLLKELDPKKWTQEMRNRKFKRIINKSA
jgi:hypothetical protein